VQEISLTAVSALLITMSAYHFFIYRMVMLRRKRHLYFAISTFGGSLFAFFAVLMPGNSPETTLLLHRLRMFGLMICIAAWVYCMYDIYFKKSLIPHIYLGFIIVIALTVPTPLFLSPPIHELHVDMPFGSFHYYYASTHTAYSLFALSILVFFSYSILRVAFCRKPEVARIYGILAFMPAIVGGINDFGVTHGYINNILVSEYLALGFLLSIFILFLREEKHDYDNMRRLNAKLEEEVAKRTSDLTRLNRELTLENEQRKKAEQERKMVIADLKQALERVKTLSGLLPICARCKKIRDDKGYWNHLEAYLHDHSNAQFTHSICPECAKKLYGDADEDE